MDSGQSAPHLTDMTDLSGSIRTSASLTPTMLGILHAFANPTEATVSRPPKLAQQSLQSSPTQRPFQWTRFLLALHTGPHMDRHMQHFDSLASPPTFLKSLQLSPVLNNLLHPP